MDLTTGTATDAVRALAAGEVGSRELLEAHLERVDRLDGAINAVVVLDVDRAREAADAADAARSRGEALGPLHGLPMTVKDTFETEGVVTTAGSTTLADHVPTRDADAVAALRGAGAVVFGKTNLPAFAADFQSYNDVYGRTNNPWDLARTPGGSSGGAAAALAAGMTLLELGSDIGGSIRNPAHYCGVFGHKPSWGVVPVRGHIPGPPGTMGASDLNVCGPLGRSVADLELAMSVLAVDVGGVPGAVLPPPRPSARALQGCRVGVWLDDPASPVDAPVLDVLRRTTDVVADEGAVVADDVRPDASLEESHAVYLRLLLAVLTSGYPREVQDMLAAIAADADPDDDSFTVTAARASVQSHHQWLSANEHRARIGAEWEAVFSQVDVVLAPVTPVAAFPHDTETPFDQRVLQVNGAPVPYPRHLVWAGLASMPLLPSTVIPLGLTADGLPVGVQIIGPRFGDRTTLAFAAALEQHIGGFRPPPALG